MYDALHRKSDGSYQLQLDRSDGDYFRQQLDDGGHWVLRNGRSYDASKDGARNDGDYAKIAFNHFGCSGDSHLSGIRAVHNR